MARLGIWVLAAALAAGAHIAPAAGAQEAERSAFDAKLERLEARHAADPRDVATIQQLAEALLGRMRTSSDPRDASRIDALVDRALALAPQSAPSWNLKAWSAMSAHRFGEALAAARKAQAIGPSNAITLGLLSDALIELGKYPEAVAITQKMMDEFPGMPAYTRAAHLRFLHGDLDGAISLMRRAAQAGRPRSEETAWTLAQLSDLYLYSGKMDLAERAAQAAIATHPGLPPGEFQMGRVREAQGRLDEALGMYRRAAERLPSAEVVYPLWRLARRLDRDAEAARNAGLLDALARLDEKSGRSRRALAMYFAEQSGGLDKAEKLARLELKHRPDVYSHETVAWVLYRAGKLAEAKAHAREALRLGTPDAAFERRPALVLAAATGSARQLQ